MGRKRQYANAAERLRAFRARASSEPSALIPTSIRPPVRPQRKISRPARLVAIGKETQALLEDYEAWRARLPESLEESDMAAKLDEAIEKLAEVAEALADIDLPKGFGRD